MDAGTVTLRQPRRHEHMQDYCMQETWVWGPFR